MVNMGVGKEIIEVKCKNCGKEIYVSREAVREDMFCTLGCLSKFEEPKTFDIIFLNNEI